jgi:predicted  nucleic acid-binding Zn-ribbon protein
VFSDSIVGVIDNTLKLHLNSGKNVTIDEFIVSVENGEILIEELDNSEKKLDISEKNLRALKKEIQKKETNLKTRQSNLENSIKELRDKKQSYRKDNDNNVKTAKKKLAEFEARKKKLKDLSE